jgi:hypothetical protein
MSTSTYTFGNEFMPALRKGASIPKELQLIIESIRPEMEGAGAAQAPAAIGFRTGSTNQGFRSFGNGVNQQPQQQSAYRSFDNGWRTAGSGASGGKSKPKPSSPPFTSPGKYQSKFTNSDTTDLNGKILNEVIGGKLNNFSDATYNDIRDFVYQVLDSGETEFLKDFVNKVFKKATREDTYCALFAQLIAEVAGKYPVMFEEIKKFHTEFLKVFDDVEEGERSEEAHQKREYRVGYGLFLSELASRNALDKKNLIEMIENVCNKIWLHSSQEGYDMMIKELVDSITRLLENLQENSPKYLKSVKGEVSKEILANMTLMIDGKAGPRPSFSSSARYCLMDVVEMLQ